MFERIQILKKKNRVFVFEIPFLFPVHIFASFCSTVEQFEIRTWKGNGKTNLMI